MSGLLAMSCLLSCGQELILEPKSITTTPFLIGKWQLVEQQISIGGIGNTVSIGGSAFWESVTNGSIFTLTEEGGFSDFQLFSNGCETGTYETTKDELILNYNCEGVESFAYTLQRENKDIILTPKTVTCIEGCAYKYRKVSN